jgi:hypothetical protein
MFENYTDILAISSQASRGLDEGSETRQAAILMIEGIVQANVKALDSLLTRSSTQPSPRKENVMLSCVSMPRSAV